MNQIEINTDGVCVFVQSKIKPSVFLKNVLRISVFSIAIGLFILIADENNPYGLILFLGGLVFTVPFIRSIFWNLYGEEFISFSTKSIVCEYNYGFFKTVPKTYVYDGRLKFLFETIREENNAKEGEVHFLTYDQHNQPFFLFKTTIYMSEADCQKLIEKLQLIFSLDKNFGVDYMMN